MAFWINIVALMRRPSVARLAAAVAVVLAVGAYFLLPTRYESDATLVLTSSPTNTAAAAGDPNASSKINPLLNFSDGLNTTLAIIVAMMNSEPVLDGLETDSGASITITNVGGASFLGNNQGPFLFLTGTSTASPQAANDIVVKTAAKTNQILLERQQSLNAPASQLISTIWVVGPTAPVASTTLKIEGAAIALVLGMLIVVAGAYLRETRSGGFPAAERSTAPHDNAIPDSIGLSEGTLVRNPKLGGRPSENSDWDPLTGRPRVAVAQQAHVDSATTPLRPPPQRPQSVPRTATTPGPVPVESRTEQIDLDKARVTPAGAPAPEVAMSPADAESSRPRPRPRPRPSAQPSPPRDDRSRPTTNGSTGPVTRDKLKRAESSFDDSLTQLLTALRPDPAAEPNKATPEQTDVDGPGVGL
ncbi:hypothetical protein [Pseudonocardia sp. 73-21]|uniref:hypothetical protein n=1 Tax=Pseudonocardia sp. 73-21 TaxID=1895809 RepID=UPI000963434B|nr:hypothetical protein [Pseudonocardia sp. 73-21]OJY44385.1 MAG: hypothetical protein BGP03_16495 [Pseudonocardia sp. 73-21]